MDKQVQTWVQKAVDEEFVSLAEKNLKKGKGLLKRLAEESGRRDHLKKCETGTPTLRCSPA